MGAIAGVFNRRSEPVSVEILTRQYAGLAHRDPRGDMSLSLLKFVGQASLVDKAMLPS